MNAVFVNKYYQLATSFKQISMPENIMKHRIAIE